MEELQIKVTTDRIMELIGRDATISVRPGHDIWLNRKGHPARPPVGKGQDTPYYRGVIKDGRWYYLARIVPNEYISEKSQFLCHLRAAFEAREKGDYEREKKQVKKACETIEKQQVRKYGPSCCGDSITCVLHVGGKTIRGNGHRFSSGSITLENISGDLMRLHWSFQQQLEDALPPEVKKYSTAVVEYIEKL